MALARLARLAGALLLLLVLAALAAPAAAAPTPLAEAPLEQWAENYYLSDEELIKATTKPFTRAYKKPTTTSLTLGAVCFVLWCGGFWYINKHSSDSGFAKFGARRIEAKVAPLWLRWQTSFCVLFFELIQLSAVTFSPTIRWNPGFNTVLEWTRAFFLIFPGDGYPYGFATAALLFALLFTALYVPLFLEWYNFHYQKKSCLWAANIFYKYPTASEVLRDFYILYLALPWGVLFASPFACTNYVFEAATVTLSGSYALECWTPKHYPFLLVGFVCGALLYGSALVSVGLDYFTKKFSDLGLNPRYLGVQLQLKAFVALTFVMFHEDYKWAYLASLFFAYGGLAFFNWKQRPCLVEKVNFHRGVAFLLAFFLVLVAINHAGFVDLGWRREEALTPFIHTLLGWSAMLGYFLLKYYVLPFRKVYPPLRIDNGLYQGDFVLSDQTRHGFGAMIWSDGRRYIGKWSWGRIHGKGILYFEYDCTYYDGDWRDNHRHGHGRANLLKGPDDWENDHDRDFRSTLSLARQRVLEDLLVATEGEHKDLVDAVVNRNSFVHGEGEDEDEEGLGDAKPSRHLLLDTNYRFGDVEDPAAAAGGTEMAEKGKAVVPDAAADPAAAAINPDSIAGDAAPAIGPEPGPSADDADDGAGSPPAQGASAELPEGGALAASGDRTEGQSGEFVADDSKYYYFYEGDWRKDVIMGYGVKQFEDGEIYAGTFQDGKEHGRGLWTFTSGLGEFAGEWSHGCLAEVHSPEGYRGGWRYGLEHGEGKRVYRDGGAYTGSWVSGKRHGKGTMVFADKTEYNGTWFNDMRHGEGSLAEPDGSHYQGFFERDQVHGWGVRTESGGETYEGNFVAGQRHGWGTVTRPEGTVYAGAWHQGVWHGKGNLDLPNGESYQGVWEDGVKCGLGEYRFPSGVVYCGAFANDMPNGKGRLTVPNLGTYDGEWRDGKKDGVGEFQFKNGCKFDGEFFMDEISGQGVMRFAPGLSMHEVGRALKLVAQRALYRPGEGDESASEQESVASTPAQSPLAGSGRTGRDLRQGWVLYEGSFHDCALEGEGRLVFSDGGEYRGEFAESRQHGRGVRQYRGGEQYEGEWHFGLRHGTGRMAYADGRVYEGDWLHDRRDGNGTLTLKDKRRFVGLFREDKMLAEGEWSG